MKITKLVFSLAAALAISTTFADDKATKEKSTAKLTSEVQKVSYAIGADLGGNFTQFKAGSKEDVLDLDALALGLRDAYEGKELAMSEEEMLETMKKFAENLQANLKKQFEEAKAKTKEESKKFLEENAKKDGVKTTKSGLQYKVITEGKGKSPSTTDTVKVHYKGQLIDGRVFDESPEDGVEFPLESVIDGWVEGLQLMKEGGKCEFYIPSDLAYGEDGQPAAGIMPGAALIFEITLDKVIVGKAADAKEEEKSEKEDKKDEK